MRLRSFGTNMALAIGKELEHRNHLTTQGVKTIPTGENISKYIKIKTFLKLESGHGADIATISKVRVLVNVNLHKMRKILKSKMFVKLSIQ